MTKPSLTQVAEFVDQTALMVGLPIPPENRQAVIDNFERIAAIAQLVLDFPLHEDIEIAPVFQPYDPHFSGRH